MGPQLMDFTTAIGIGKALGGLFGKKKKGPSIAEQYQMQRDHHRLMPGVTRDGYERAGFNPLLGVQGGASIPFQPSLIGDSHSTAGGIFAEGLDMVHDGLLQKTQLAQENEKLRETIDDLAKPSQPSHMDRYGDTIPLPSNGEMNGTQSSTDIRVAGVRPDGPQVSTDRPLKITSPYGTLETDPNWTPAEQIEAEYGEPAAWLYSGVRLADGIADQIAAPIIQRAEKTRQWRQETKRELKRANKPKIKRRAASGWGNSPARSIAPTQREIDNHGFRRRALFGG